MFSIKKLIFVSISKMVGDIKKRAPMSNIYFLFCISWWYLKSDRTYIKETCVVVKNGLNESSQKHSLLKSKNFKIDNIQHKILHKTVKKASRWTGATGMQYINNVTKTENDEEITKLMLQTIKMKKLSNFI